MFITYWLTDIMSYGKLRVWSGTVRRPRVRVFPVYLWGMPHTCTYRVAQKWHSFLYAFTSSNINNRFSQIFYCRNQEKMCN